MLIMEARISPSSSKTQKRLMGQDAAEGEDIISKLPDYIILYILSFLPIKDVLRTSVLSTRWKYLWTSVLDIDYDENSYKPGEHMRDNFLDSCERLLCFHDHTCIRKFRLLLRTSAGASRVSLWVSAALRHKIQELDLYLPVETLFVLPNSLFTSESLSVLKLNLCLPVKVPNSIKFPNLKSLHLTVAFQDDSSAEQLFAGCPVLQELALYYCVWKNTKKITVSVPSLRTLTFCGRLGSLSRGHGDDCVITIYAENLISLKCVHCLAVELSVCNISSLSDAYISLATWGLSDEELARRAIKLIHGIYSVKSLTMSNDTLQSLAVEENLQAFLPTFRSLTHLKVKVESGDGSDQVLMHFLQKSPNLEYLVIPEVFHRDNGWLLKVVPQCVKSSLKNVCISYFEGDVTDVRFLKYLFENANLLERVTVLCSKVLARNLEKQSKINQQLQAVRTGSTACVVEYQEDSSLDIFTR